MCLFGPRGYPVWSLVAHPAVETAVCVEVTSRRKLDLHAMPDPDLELLQDECRLTSIVVQPQHLRFGLPLSLKYRCRQDLRFGLPLSLKHRCRHEHRILKV